MGSTGASVLKILRNAVAVIGDFGAAVSTPAAAMTRIKGFWVYWAGEHYVWAEREVAPNHKYRFEISADWKQIGRLWMSPVDVASTDPVKDAERFAKKARGAVEEFLLLEREGH